MLRALIQHWPVILVALVVVYGVSGLVLYCLMSVAKDNDDG